MKLLTSDRNMAKYEQMDDNLKQKFLHETIRAILTCCINEGHVFKVDPFKKSLEENLNQTLPAGSLIPFLGDVNEQLMDTFGYCIAPINYGSRRVGLDASGGTIKEITLINTVSVNEVKDANASQIDKAERAKLFLMVCFLFLSNGSEEERAKEQLKLITGDRSEAVDALLQKWTKQRYLNAFKVRKNDKEITKYEIGLRAFVEIGYKNITKFVATVMDIEFTEDMPKKWLDDMLGKLDPIEGEAATPKKEKTPKKTKPATRGRRKKEEEPEYNGPEEEEPEEAIEYAED
ncbi:hypothetical protein AV274_0897 [Blastocystis sp. ATCC 50177/Nand II]|uniref:MAGE domain-containing protein n=1 Tax=Blastocystis sp. subtype 1 (strain ATCC 50177 / NandII) TaxID=478820 RepID=A0A196SK03_BLAHN|nr:hypothetical protein AV274_0897 [Blastocystis sp. ATCC 50177/Nand II]